MVREVNPDSERSSSTTAGLPEAIVGQKKYFFSCRSGAPRESAMVRRIFAADERGMEKD